jgi:hypothetical protein
MWKTFSLLFCLTALAQVLRCQDASAENFTPDQLDNLLAPVALYPDPLLAQVLVAATFPDQIDEAARFVRAGSDPTAIDNQAWDVSVKAVAHYPDVLSMMADSLDWTSALGQAYVAQPDDVMASVQRLRQQAQAAGNLDTGPEQEVVDDGSDIEIWPAQPQVIYVPVYDPDVVYFGSGGIAIVTFGAACPIGAWLNLDFDWHHRRVFYHGWNNGPGWVGRARPYVQLNGVYVDSRFQKVATGRADPGRTINRVALDRFASVHRNVPFNQARAGAPPNGNKIIERNIDTGDPRIETFRGRSAPASPPQADAQVQTYRASRPPESAPQPAPQEYHAPAPLYRTPPAPQPQPSRNEAFGGNRGPFPTQAASQRGQQSRAMAPPAPRPAPPPAPASAPASRAPEGRR